MTGESNNDTAVMKFRQKLNSSESYFNPQPIPKNESDKEAHIKCSDIEGAKKYCPTRWAALQRWFAESRKVTCTWSPPGGVGVLELTFARYVLPACRRLLFPLLQAEKGRRPFSACNKGNRRRLHVGKVCAAGLSEPQPHYSLFCGQLYTPS